MREAVIVVLVLACPAAVHAGSCGSRSVAGARIVPGEVAVTMKVGERMKGALICMDRDVVVLADGTRLHTVPLRDVDSIVKPTDRLWNGLAIGAAIGLLGGAMMNGEARYSRGGGGNGSAVLGSMALYALIGAGIDALHGSGWTIYEATRGSRSSAPVADIGPALAFRVRF